MTISFRPRWYFFVALVSVTFIGGVAASYIAGYSGMVMAVNGALSIWEKRLHHRFGQQ